MKPFSKWSIEDVENEFGLRPTRKSNLLESWLTVESSPSPFEQQWLEMLRGRLGAGSYSWNEQELIAKFIAPLLSLVNFEQEEYREFLNRNISVGYKDETLSGEVDFVVAQGRHSPQRPFFFLHEDKKENEKGDPLGQLMIAMVAAQLINQNDQPLYGVYIIGRYWHFVVLEGKTYSVHRGSNAASNDVEMILGVLKNMKPIIEQMLQAE